MQLIDKTEEITIELDRLIQKLNDTLLRIEPMLDLASGCQKINNENRFPSITFFYLNNTFASVCELRNCLQSKSFISAMLITRHLVEIYADFMLLLEGDLDKNANAVWFYSEMRNSELNNRISQIYKDNAKKEWQQYRLEKNNDRHWSGLSRTEVIKRAWGTDSSVYGILSATGHFSLLTQDLVFWNYSERAIGFISANVDASIGMIEEIFSISKDKKLCGVKI
ncbi:MAG: hypothetical protein RLZZ76_261 [Candidatus Parcubacteria bacterium]|jgi:hypothetical protein